MNAEYKYQTKLVNFALNSVLQKVPLLIEWYKLDETDDGFSGIGMDLNNEIVPLEYFMLTRPNNFFAKNYFILGTNSPLYIPEPDLLPQNGIKTPKYLMLRKGVESLKNTKLPSDILLLNEQGAILSLDALPFSIIGQIL